MEYRPANLAGNLRLTTCLAMLGMAGLLLVVRPVTADEPRAFLFLKTGEKFATQEIAGPTVQRLTGYLGLRLAGSADAFAPRVTNQPQAAVRLVATEKPGLGIVTPGFYLTYRKAFSLVPVAEVVRRGLGETRFLLVSHTDAPTNLDQLAGKRIATALAAEQRYVMSVILDNKLGQELHFIEVTDNEGALFDLAEQSNQAADLVLVHHSIWDLYRDDPDLGTSLRAVYESDVLPHDLLVVFGETAAGLDQDKLRATATAMAQDEEGKEILQSIQVEAFVPVDRERLARVQERFDKK